MKNENTHRAPPPSQSAGVSYGLHYRCFSTTGTTTIGTRNTTTCVRFPQFDDCTGDDRQFCSMWRSVGFFMSFAVLLEGMTLITYIIILAGGKQVRESGWRILSLFLVLVALVQCASMGLVVSFRLPFSFISRKLNIEFFFFLYIFEGGGAGCG